MLNPDQFFHGTTAAVKDGMVRPANAVDKNPSEWSMGDPGDMSEGDHAFAVRGSEYYAWHAAHNFHNNGRRPRVYEVDPAKDMKPGPWNKEHPDFLEHNDLDSASHPDDIQDAMDHHQDEWASKTGFRVRKRIDIMPGRQGTFSEVNWNKYKSVGARFGPDANHPNHEQALYGMHHEDIPKTSDLPEPEEEPRRRSGASLRAFMEGKPEPKPEPRHELTLF